MTDEETKTIVAALMQGVIMFILGMSFYCAWLFFAAPRDPGGMLCDEASLIRSVLATAGGTVETGCAWHDKPIEESPIVDP